MQRGGWLLVFGLGFGSLAFAQQTPNAAPAFRAEGLYDYSGFDQVSLFSGGLSAQIPITTFGAEVQVPIVLSYSSSAWEARPTTCPPSNGICGATMKPKPSDRVGLGFKVTLGELYQPAFGSNQAINRWVYVSWDGAEHALYPKLHPDDQQDVGDPDPSTGMFEKVMYSRDSSYIRAKCTSANFGDCTVETSRWFAPLLQPDGHDGFAQLSARVDHRPLRECRHDQLRLESDAVDDHGRAHLPETNPERKVVLTFAPPESEAADQPLLLRTIEAPCFLATEESTCRGLMDSVATWTFDYGEDPRLTYPPSVYTQSPEQRAVWFLASVELPDGLMFSFPDYVTDFHGGLKTAILPTFGRLEWEWGRPPPAFRAKRSSAAQTSSRPMPSIGARPTLSLSAASSISAAHLSASGTTRAKLTSRSPRWARFSRSRSKVRCTTFPSIFCDLGGQLLLHPKSTRARNGNMACPTREPVKTRLKARRRDSCLQRTTTVRIFPNPVLEDCTLKRSVYQAWEVDDGDSIGGWNNGEVHDRNRRMRSERTIFHEPTGDKYRLTQFSNFDGLGHYRTTVLSDGVAGYYRTTSTSFNYGRGEYTGLPGQVYDPVDARNANEYWVLGTYSDQSTSETSIVNDPSGTSTQTAKEEFCFDAPTGFLKRHRRLSSSR